MKRVVAFIAVMGLVLAISVIAQEQHSAAPIIGVSIESSDGRIQNWSSELLDQATAVVEKVAKKARVIPLAGRGRDVADAASKRAVDYLITIEISPRPYGEVSIGGPAYQNPEVAGEPRANAQGSIFVAWTVRALNGKAIKLHDSRTVQASEYPLEPQFDWLRSIASRSVRDAAAAAAEKLRKKAGI